MRVWITALIGCLLLVSCTSSLSGEPSGNEGTVMDEEGEDVAGEQNETGDGAPAETGDILQDVELLDTSGWETYRNEEWGFEMRYPEKWEVRSKRNSGKLILHFVETSTPLGEEDEFGGFIDVVADRMDPTQPLEQWCFTPRKPHSFLCGLTSEEAADNVEQIIFGKTANDLEMIKFNNWWGEWVSDVFVVHVNGTVLEIETGDVDVIEHPNSLSDEIGRGNMKLVITALHSIKPL